MKRRQDMKKRGLCLMCGLLAAVLLAGCGQEVESKADGESQSMFVVVEETWNWKVVYHQETGVMYAVSSGSYNAGSFTVLLNADGTPMVWQEANG